MKKFRTLKTTIVAALCLVAFLGTSYASDKPIKIGVLLPFSGVQAIVGETIFKAMEIAFEDANYQAGGRKLILVKEDTEMNPKMGLTKARKLVERDQVDILSGLVSSAVAYAIRDYVVAQKIPLVIANAGAQGLTREKASKYIFRTAFANGQYVGPLGPYSANKMGLKEMAVFCPDYAAGHEKASVFTERYTKAGGTVTETVFTKLGIEDFGPYMTKLKKADGVFAFYSGGDAIKFVKQYNDYGLKSKMPLVADGSVVDEVFIDSLGDAAIGIISSMHYSATLDNPENKKFVSKFRAKDGRMPNGFARQGYTTGAAIIHALNAIKGKIEDKEAFLEALKNAEFNDPAGKFRFDKKTQNIIFDVYIRKVEKVDGQLVNTIIDVVKDQADVWTSK
ncbi:MAG: ABC transporter substrate-binding protein [Desulfobacteraceae bacterium]|nr:MAG: ABC transporter substrate-binding protein [Desulfobacteraceae bacterium]